MIDVEYVSCVCLLGMFVHVVPSSEDLTTLSLVPDVCLSPSHCKALQTREAGRCARVSEILCGRIAEKLPARLSPQTGPPLEGDHSSPPDLWGLSQESR